jgi:hypothetical protein
VSETALNGSESKRRKYINKKGWRQMTPALYTGV